MHPCVLHAALLNMTGILQTVQLLPFGHACANAQLLTPASEPSTLHSAPPQATKTPWQLLCQHPQHHTPGVSAVGQLNCTYPPAPLYPSNQRP
jgi:hypothetical protein